MWDWWKGFSLTIGPTPILQALLSFSLPDSFFSSVVPEQEFRSFSIFRQNNSPVNKETKFHYFVWFPFNERRCRTKSDQGKRGYFYDQLLWSVVVYLKNLISQRKVAYYETNFVLVLWKMLTLCQNNSSICKQSTWINTHKKNPELGGSSHFTIHFF